MMVPKWKVTQSKGRDLKTGQKTRDCQRPEAEIAKTHNYIMIKGNGNDTVKE